MATYDPEFYEAPKFSAEYVETPPRQRGCLFYGCVIASVLAVLLMIALAVVAYFGWRFANRMKEEYTAKAPESLPKVEMSEEERKTVQERFDAFRKALDEGEPSEPLVLTSDDLNALIEQNPDLRGTVYAKVEGDKLKAQVSFPLDRLDFGFLKGRYLNGEAELKASLNNGVLMVTLDSFEVNGKRPPESMLTEMRQQNMAKDMYKNPHNAETISKLESLEIKDGKIIVRARAREKTGPESDSPKSPPPSDTQTPKPPKQPPATPKAVEAARP